MRIPRYLLRQNGTVKRYKGTGGNGTAIYETIGTWRCHLERKTTVTNNGTGGDVVTNYKGIFEPETLIKAEDQVIVTDPKSNKSKTHKVFQVEEARDFLGVTHLEVLLL